LVEGITASDHIHALESTGKTGERLRATRHRRGPRPAFRL
jgi:hypothetical protein